MEKNKDIFPNLFALSIKGHLKTDVEQNNNTRSHQTVWCLPLYQLGSVVAA